MNNVISQFRDAMRAAGLEPPDVIEAGELHRFPGEGKSNGNRAGWCKLFHDGEGGVYGDWSSGLSKTWQANRDKPLTQEERAAFSRMVKDAKAQAECERQQKQAEAATRAAEIWQQATPAVNHEYLTTKGIQPHGIRQHDGCLVIPMRNRAKLYSLQFITTDGNKRFLTGGRTKGTYYSIGLTDSVVCICEGFATGASINQATGYAVAVAFNAGNLKAVAETMRGKFPDVRLIVCGDNDESGTGQTKAKEAAAAVGGSTAIPPERGDWNDYAQAHGPEVAKNTILSLSNVSVSDIKPLPELPAVASFQFELLPETLQPWARDIVERIQCPADYVGITVMCTLGAVIGRKVGVRPQQKTDWTEYPNQWAMLIGRPGVLKSPAMEQVLTPIKRLAAESAETYQSELAEYQVNAKMAKLQHEAAEKEARAKLKKNPHANVSELLAVHNPDEPMLKRFIANDTSAASLGELVRQNPNGLLVYRDEIVSLLKGLDREDNADARGFYLTGWNGNSSYTFDRIGRGLNLHIPAVCLSLLGSTQPGRIAEYIKHAVNGGSGDDGLIQRFGLLVWPDINGEWRDVDEWPDSNAKRTACDVFTRLGSLQPQDVGAEYDEYSETNFLRFSEKALTEFREWREGWERKLRSGDLHPAVESHLAKYRKLIPSLALIIHLADNGTGAVSHTATLKALAWSEYLETHAVRVYASVTTPEVQAAKAILRRIEKGDLKDTFTARSIYRNGWAHLGNSRRVHEALALMVDCGFLRAHTIETEGRPSTAYRVMP